MKPAEEYSVLDEPRRAWAEGWWQGIAVGCTIGVCIGVFLYEVAKVVR